MSTLIVENIDGWLRNEIRELSRNLENLSLESPSSAQQLRKAM
jgi:hypothetical protein